MTAKFAAAIWLLWFAVLAIGFVSLALLHRDPPRYGSEVKVADPFPVPVKEWTGPIEGETP